MYICTYHSLRFRVDHMLGTGTRTKWSFDHELYINNFFYLGIYLWSNYHLEIWHKILQLCYCVVLFLFEYASLIYSTLMHVAVIIEIKWTSEHETSLVVLNCNYGIWIMILDSIKDTVMPFSLDILHNCDVTLVIPPILKPYHSCNYNGLSLYSPQGKTSSNSIGRGRP